MIKRAALLAITAIAIGATAISGAFAQAFPSRPIMLVIPVPAGGPPDHIGRMISSALSSGLGQPVYVQNMAGSTGDAVLAALRKAPADGHTLVFWRSGNSGLASMRAIAVAGIATIPVRRPTPTGTVDETYGIVVKEGTPGGVVARLAAEVNRAVASDQVRAVLAQYNGSPAGPDWQNFAASRGGVGAVPAAAAAPAPPPMRGPAPGPMPSASGAVPDCNNPLNIQTIEQLDYCAQNSPKYDVPRR